jgi:hypothetical protein
VVSRWSPDDFRQDNIAGPHGTYLMHIKFLIKGFDTDNDRTKQGIQKFHKKNPEAIESIPDINFLN